MAWPSNLRRFTEDEYLMLERASDSRSEFLDGQIFAMSGGSRAHSLIAGNLAGFFRAALRGGPCETHQSDMRLEVKGSGLYTYPDVMVACAPLDLADEHADTLRNPILLVEVLSPSTEAYDRGEKLLRYQRLPSLRHYLLVAQDQPRIDHYQRADEVWRIESVVGLEAQLALDALGLTLDLATVYERVAERW